LLDSIDARGHLRDGLVVAHRPESARSLGIGGERGRQTIGMRSLQVALDPFGTELALVERKLHPGLEANDLLVLDEEGDSTLLAAEAAMRIHGAIRDGARVEPRPGRARRMGAETFDEGVGGHRKLHGALSSQGWKLLCSSVPRGPRPSPSFA